MFHQNQLVIHFSPLLLQTNTFTLRCFRSQSCTILHQEDRVLHLLSDMRLPQIWTARVLNYRADVVQGDYNFTGNPAAGLGDVSAFSVEIALFGPVLV